MKKTVDRSARKAHSARACKCASRIPKSLPPKRNMGNICEACMCYMESGRAKHYRVCVDCENKYWDSIRRK
jgi:hypothetical protein